MMVLIISILAACLLKHPPLQYEEEIIEFIRKEICSTKMKCLKNGQIGDLDYCLQRKEEITIDAHTHTGTNDCPLNIVIEKECSKPHGRIRKF